MLKRIVESAIRKEEANLGASLDYLREVATVSKAGFFKIALLTPFSRHRKRLPKTAYHLAKIVVTHHEDCGICVQMAVNLAIRDGVPVHYIRAVLENQIQELPPALQEVSEFAYAIAEGWENGDTREALRARYGTEGLAELAFAIASAQIYPTLKRAMGHGQSCALTQIAV